MGGGSRGTRDSYSTVREKVNTKIPEYSEEGRLVGNSRKKVLTSFHSKDLHAKQLFIHQAKNNKYKMNFINYTTDEPFDSRWRAQWRERMMMCSTLVVLIGPETHQREAVKWEINTAYNMGKKVIGVRVHRYENHQIPQPMKDNGAPVVNWDMKEISQELNN